MIQKPLNEITIDDVSELVTNSVPEGRNLDYKRDLCGNSYSEKKEFLADISSFANATGGDLLFGVDETDGAASAIPGLVGFNADKDPLRLESSIRDGIEPRIPGIQFKAIEGATDGPVLIVRIPNSWASPHMVTFKGTSRFFSRGSAGKFQMDVVEIRSAFEGTGAVSNKILNWKSDRIGKIIAGDNGFTMASMDIVALHLVPFESVSDQWRFSIEELKGNRVGFWPLGATGLDPYLNLEGLAQYQRDRDPPNLCQAYSQVFRSGKVEIVFAGALNDIVNNPSIRQIHIEKEVVKKLKTYLDSYNALGIQPPVALSMTYLGVKGKRVTNHHLLDAFDGHAIDRDPLFLPDLVINEFDCHVSQILKPLFDAFWNACGYSKSLCYDNDGNWNVQRLGF